MIQRLLQFIKDFWRGGAFGAVRSPKWSQTRKDFLILHDRCEVCGKKRSLLKPLEVHHIVPFSQNKFLELDFQNLITLCRDEHFIFGHLKSWKSWNSTIKEDAREFNLKITSRP